MENNILEVLVEIEQTSPRDSKNIKIQYTYDKSLVELRKRGHERHLGLDEAFKIIIAAIENPNSQYKSISDDMLSSYGEWLSLAIKRLDEESLVTYLHPENLIWDDKKQLYLAKGKTLQHSEERIFNVKGIPSNYYVPLNKFPDDLVTFLYSKPFSQLPKKIQEKAHIWLPKKGDLWPLGRGGFDVFDIVMGFYDRASRGVRECHRT